MGSPRPLVCSRRTLSGVLLAAAALGTFALGVRLGTAGLPALARGARFEGVTTDRVALVAPPAALPSLIPFGGVAVTPLSDETALALLDRTGPPGAATSAAAGAAPADAAAPGPAPAGTDAPLPLAGLPITPPPVVLPSPSPVPEIALPEPETALREPLKPLEPLPAVPQLVTLVGGLLSLPVL